MKIQDLAIIFVIIIIPISLILSVFTQFQMQTINTQTLYDTKLTSATYDAIKAFQLNSTNEDYSSLATSKLRGLEASIVTFRNSLKSAFEMNGFTEDELNNYIPALVYTLYDGFYIYSPYENTNHRYETVKDEQGKVIKDPYTDEPQYETDASGEKIPTDENGEKLYGLKPYITYSCRYVYPDLATPNPSIDVVISYALDNYITVQGMVNGVYVNEGGYLIEDIDTTSGVKYNGVSIGAECLTEWLPIGTGANLNEFKYAKLNGKKFYLNDNMIFSIENGTIHKQVSISENEDVYKAYKELIESNKLAQSYYTEAEAFTQKIKDLGLDKLKYSNAYDEVIGTDGEINIQPVWPDDDRKIFVFDSEVNIENETSNFNQHRLAVIRHKIETNLAIAISNYNDYSGATNEFQMPELKENEWDCLINNISLISFLQGLPIEGKTYNGYTIVTNSETEDVVLEENIYILGNDDAYHRIGDKLLESSIDAIGARLNVDFKRKNVFSNDGTIQLYYYPVRVSYDVSYDASYDSIVTQNNVTTFDDIYSYIDEQKDEGNIALAQAFYTALGRERMAMYRATNITNETYANGIFNN